MDNDTSCKKTFRMVTYLYPGLPIGLFQAHQYYLEEVLGREAQLVVESRSSGPMINRMDPFTSDDADLAFMCSTSFLRLLDEKNKYIELVPAAPIHIHPKSELRPIYFADVIVHGSRKDMYKDFSDLKGHRWAYNDDMSLSGNISTLVELRRMGTNANFFGTVIQSGSHLNSIQMVLENRVDATAIDSNVLIQYLLEHPEHRKEVHVLCSWGPLPIYPIVINSRLPDDTKKKITQALLSMNRIEKWNKELARYNVWGFKASDVSLYDQEKAIKSMVKEQTLNAVYY